MAGRTPSDLVKAAEALLTREWTNTLARTETSDLGLDPALCHAIKRAINSRTMSYRYVLPTQVLAKSAAPELDCRVIQESAPLAGAFDARSLCHKVIVPFDRENECVLGGSKEPYVNNPLRIPAILEEHASAQKNKKGFADLCMVLNFCQERPDEAGKVLRMVLAEVCLRLQETSVRFPVPNRVSLKECRRVVNEFTKERTGGLRLQAVAAALFETVGHAWNLFDEVRSGNINSADARTGSVADLECVSKEGELVLAVEVKDRRLTLRHLQDKLPVIREKAIKEILFLVREGLETSDAEAVEAAIDREFNTGQNVYVCEFSEFLQSVLALLGEEGRRKLLLAIGLQMDVKKADLVHRKKWQELLESL
ncbi:MAG: restriction endonuclease, SacI family [Candidatus Hydrogenedentes bacterium]|nr:restriction endonuclease, SacI family [Candidatus Hydrogenedentota bacterium]